MPRADTLVWLDFPRMTCLRRVIFRALMGYGGPGRTYPRGVRRRSISDVLGAGFGIFRPEPALGIPTAIKSDMAPTCVS